MKKIDKKKEELEALKSIAYSAGILQGEVTIKTLLESLAEGVVIVNSSGRIILINNRLSEMIGYSKLEVMGENLNLFIPHSMHAKHTAHLKNFFNEPRVRPMGIDHDLIAKRKDNTTFPIEISLSYLETETGILGIGFLTDISSRKKVENDLKKRNQELDEYAHTVAHDLTSSLAGMIGFSELLIDSEEDIAKEVKDNYLKQIAFSGRKMATVINELLIFASMKKEDINIVPVDMSSVIHSTVQRLKYQIENLSAKIVVNKNIDTCSGYSFWIEEVMFNYLSNALKYGGKPPLIEVYSEKLDNGFVKYSVKDNGKGISQEYMDIIFENKNKSKDKLDKGLGLGLSIVKRIIEKLDGYVSVESEVGKGSIFSFCLKE